jgi:hypothetical protein
MSTKKQARKAADKAAKEARKAKKKAEQDSKESVYVAGEVKTVKRAQRFSMRALPMELQLAVRKFESDYESAFEALSAPAAGVKVDGGGIPQVHISRLAAQERVAKLAKFIGRESYAVLVAVVICGANAEQLSGVDLDKREAGSRIRAILSDVSEFYSGVRPRDRILEAAQKIIEAAEYGSDRRILEAEKEYRIEVEASGRPTRNAA